MMIRLCIFFTVAAAVASAYSTPRPVVHSAKKNVSPGKAFATAAASASFAFVLAGSPLHAYATSKTAGQISLNAIPPSSVMVDVRDLPVIGDLVSGTYTRVNDKDVTSPSVSIKSPKDKIGAIKAATAGHIEFDVNGILATHLDIDVSADEAGVLTAKVYSPLVPKLPFKNSASSADATAFKGKSSNWNKVTNMGDGDIYYFNSKTDETSFEKPNRI